MEVAVDTAPAAAWLDVAEGEIEHHAARISMLTGRVVAGLLATTVSLMATSPSPAVRFVLVAAAVTLFVVSMRAWDALLVARMWVKVGEPVAATTEMIEVSAPAAVMRLAAGRHLFVTLPGEAGEWLVLRPPASLTAGTHHTWIITGTGPNRIVAAPDSTPVVLRWLG